MILISDLYMNNRRKYKQTNKCSFWRVLCRAGSFWSQQAGFSITLLAVSPITQIPPTPWVSVVCLYSFLHVNLPLTLILQIELGGTLHWFWSCFYSLSHQSFFFFKNQWVMCMREPLMPQTELAFLSYSEWHQTSTGWRCKFGSNCQWPSLQLLHVSI